jgi:hypothetical protein
MAENFKIPSHILDTVTQHVGRQAHERLKNDKGHVWVKGDDKDDLIADAKGYASLRRQGEYPNNQYPGFAMPPPSGAEMLSEFVQREAKELALNNGQVAALTDILKGLKEFQ